MNLITAENRELALSMSINQRNPHEPSKVRYGGLLLGTDFRHAVEFSRSGRAESRTLTGLRPWRLVPRYAVHGSLSHPGGSDLAAPGPSGPVSLGAKKKLRGHSGRVKPGGHRWAAIRVVQALTDSEPAGREGR